MNIHKARYELTAVRPDQYPETVLPRIAFLGRSNVGKSSFINTLLNRRNLARVGSSPGKTREINFYNIDEKLHLVDLPGYGYAGVSKEKKSTWGPMIETFLSVSTDSLLCIIMLVDIRHSPSKDDKIMAEWLMQSSIKFYVVATKTDKISRSAVHGRLKDICTVLDLPEHMKPIPFSSETTQGKDEVWGLIKAQLADLAEITALADLAEPTEPSELPKPV